MRRSLWHASTEHARWRTRTRKAEIVETLPLRIAGLSRQARALRPDSSASVASAPQGVEGFGTGAPAPHMRTWRLAPHCASLDPQNATVECPEVQLGSEGLGELGRSVRASVVSRSMRRASHFGRLAGPSAVPVGRRTMTTQTLALRVVSHWPLAKI